MSGQTDDDITQWEKVPPEEVLDANLKDLDKEDAKNLDVRYLQPDDLARMHAAPQSDELTRVHTLPLKTLPFPIKTAQPGPTGQVGKAEQAKPTQKAGPTWQPGQIVPVPVMVPPEHRMEPVALTKSEAANNNTEVVSRPTKTLPGIGGPEPDEPPRPPKEHRPSNERKAKKPNKESKRSDETTAPCLRAPQEQTEKKEKRPTLRDKMMVASAVSVIVVSLSATLVVFFHGGSRGKPAQPTADSESTSVSVANANPSEIAPTPAPIARADLDEKPPVVEPVVSVAPSHASVAPALPVSTANVDTPNSGSVSKAKPPTPPTVTATSNAGPNAVAVANTNRVNAGHYRKPTAATPTTSSVSTAAATRESSVPSVPTVEKKPESHMDWRGEM